MQTYDQEQELGKTIVGKLLQKIGRGAKTVALAPVRLAWLTAMKANFGGISAKLKFGYSTAEVAARYGYSARQYAIIRSQLLRVQNSFTKAGGKANNLKNAILNGRGNQGHAISGLGGLEGADVLSILEPILAILKVIGGIVSKLKPSPVEDEEDEEPAPDDEQPQLSYVNGSVAATEPPRREALLAALADNYLGIGRRLAIGLMTAQQAADNGIGPEAWQQYRRGYLLATGQLARELGIDQATLRHHLSRAWQVSLAGPYRSGYRPFQAWLTATADRLNQIDLTSA